MSGFDDAPQPASEDLAPTEGGFEVDLAAFLPDGVTLGEPEPEPEPAAFQAAETTDGAEAADERIDEVEVVAEEAPAASGAGVDLDALRQIELDLDAVDAAIAALDAGTYGLDAETGERIDDDLLAADPTRLS